MATALPKLSSFIKNTLTETNAGYTLDARQGKVLKDMITAIVDNSLNGTNYLMVYGTGTPTENAAELQAAYEEAKLMSPTSTNRITVIVAPGDYRGATAFEHDTPCIDIVSLTGNADVKLNGIYITAGYTFIKGIDCGNVIFRVGNNIPTLICDTCIGGISSFSGDGENASGKFIDCIGLDDSFGSDASGIFIRCTGGAGSFGGYSSLTGVLEYCKITSGTFPTSGGHLLYCIEGTSVVTSR